MYVSHESPEEIDRRLRRVIGEAELRVYDQPYLFDESPRKAGCTPSDHALACVRDDEVWSQLVATTRDAEGELFRIFRFHFPASVDNSGFVGWLASHLKVELGTGVFVVCGQNSGHGGIFDYWGCPWELGDEVLAEVERLRG